MNTQQERMKNAVVYIRSARAPEGSDQAIAAQREACHRIAERHGLTIIREYADLGRAAHLEQQTELRNLLSTLATQRDAAYLIVWDYTRLSRNLTVLNQLIEQCRTYGAQVVTLTGVEVAQRFMVSGGLPDDARESPDRSTPGLFPLSLIQAAFSGLSPRESLVVTAILPS